METTAAPAAIAAGDLSDDEVVAGPAVSVFGRVVGLSLIIGSVAGALYLLAVRPLDGYVAPVAVSWLILTVGYAASELTVVHIEFRRDAHSVSLNEIPLVLGLVFVSPTHLLVAHLIGAGVILVLHRRQAVL